MDSPQNQRYQDRLARQRGAGTHKVANAGFTIKPLAPAAAAVLPPLPQLPSPKAVDPKSATPVQAPPRRSSRSVSRNNSPTTDAQAPTTRAVAGPSSLRESTATSSRTPTQAGSPLPTSTGTPQTAATATRRTSLRTVGTPTVSLPESGVAALVTRSETPTSHVSSSRASTRSTARRPPAVAEVTPVARGKRMRQPSPDKFLTPEATGASRKVDLFTGGSAVEAGVDTGDEDTGDITRGAVEDVTMAVGKVVVEGEEEEEEEEITLEIEGAVDYETEDETMQEVIEDATTEMEDATMETEDEVEELDDTVGGAVEDTTIEDIEEDGPEHPTIAIKSPENRNKRRKVILEELEPEPEDASLKEPVVDVETPNLKRKRQTTGKKSAPSQAPEVEEDEEAIEETLGLEPELGAGLGVPEEGQNSHPQPRKIPTKPHATTQLKPKPKPHRRAQRPSDDHEPLPPFTVEVHRLGKSGNFTLPPGSQRAGVNAIDVISQVSMEFINNCYLKLKSSTERKAVENFKEELGLRFLELTDAVENNIVLTTRVKQGQKRKAQLMLELLSIKQDREKVAVRIDDVRKTHELATKNNETQQHMSKTFEDISGTLERGKARQLEDGEEIGMDGLGALVRKVSAAVTGGDSGGTGLLATVVEFNRFLEKTERALSGRRRRD